VDAFQLAVNEVVAIAEAAEATGATGGVFTVIVFEFGPWVPDEVAPLALY
jgi:hypothetical protein